MQRKLTSVILLTCFTLAAQAQIPGAKWIVQPALADLDSIEYSRDGHESLLIGWKNKNKGLFTLDGKTILPAEYANIAIYPGGWIGSYKNNKSVLLNEAGKALTDGYEKFELNGTRYALVSNGGKWGAIDNTGKVLVPVEHERYLRQGDRFVFFKGSEEVELINPPAPPFKNAQKAADEKARAVLPGMIQIGSNAKTGFLNLKGDTIIPPLYKFGAIHPKGYLVASLEPNKWGVIDKTHKTLRVFTAERIGEWTDSGLLPVKENKQWGLFRFPAGTAVFPFGKYDAIEVFDKKKDWFKVTKDKLSGVVDATGKVVLPLEYSTIAKQDDNMTQLWKDKLQGYWYLPKNKVQEPAFQGVRNVKDSLIILEKDSVSGVLNVKTGKMVLPYDTFYLEKRGEFFVASKSGNDFFNTRYNRLYNRQGKLVFEQDSTVGAIQLFCNNSFLVSQSVLALKAEKPTEHRDATGKMLRTFPTSSAYYRDKCWIRYNPGATPNNRYLLVTDPPGNDQYYDDVSLKPVENLYVVRMGDRYGYVNSDAKVVVPLVLDAAKPSDGGCLRVKYQGKWGVLQNPSWP